MDQHIKRPSIDLPFIVLFVVTFGWKGYQLFDVHDFGIMSRSAVKIVDGRESVHATQ
jgi:hypothetical protein